MAQYYLNSIQLPQLTQLEEFITSVGII